MRMERVSVQPGYNARAYAAKSEDATMRMARVSVQPGYNARAYAAKSEDAAERYQDLMTWSLSKALHVESAG
jgi:hypothetical protein